MLSSSGVNYRFSDLLRVVNQDNNSYHSIVHEGKEAVLLKGPFAIQKFNIAHGMLSLLTEETAAGKFFGLTVGIAYLF